MPETHSGLLIGKFFRDAVNGTNYDSPHRQGKIIGCVGDRCLVRFHSWYNGGAEEQRLIPLSDIVKCLFYDSYEEMRDAYATDFKGYGSMTREDRIEDFVIATASPGAARRLLREGDDA